ncbi:hypothetical protein TRICI_002918 [Trichomonascus ciferrii]|uniref:ER membrane protein complex subunit 10 n=1 Tax=Trichomonascus ciferrii TaxID=44093 RepID=A0A642V4J3_9ASCO|nr:hypothetical protein TRICI_002918 [Trichomonascus ciferrii]
MVVKLLIAFTILLQIAFADNLKVLIQPLGSTETILRGVISYDPEDVGDVTYERTKQTVSGKACVGIELSGKDFKCMALGNLNNTASDKIVVYLNKDNSVRNLDYSVDDTDNVQVIRRDAKGPVPGMKEPIKLVDNEVPQEEPPKTFIQKYWMYIVPVVLMLMVSGGADPNQQR